MYKRNAQGWLKHIDFIILDIACLCVSFFLAIQIRFGEVRTILETRPYMNLLLELLVFDLLIILAAETMHNVVRLGYFKTLMQAVKQDIMVFGAATVFLFTMKDAEQISRTVLWLTLALQIVISYVTRILWRWFILRRHTREKKQSMLLVADEGNVPGVLKRFNENPLEDVKITGVVVADRDAEGTEIEGIPVVCNLGDAPKYICREWIDEVYISTATPPLDLLDRCLEMGVTTHRELHTAGGDRQFVERMAGEHVITNTMNATTPAQLIGKRLVDILGGIVGSLLALIIIAIVGPRIKKESPGPILFKQERIGQNGKHFKMYKIRSMYMDAEDRKAELMKDNRVSDGMMFKLDFDPRIIGNRILPDGTRQTGIGEFIRNRSLDEYPQFFNVLLGQMSLVGTRPPTVDEWERYEYHHRARLAIKPGLTGMWQVSGRSNITDFEEVVRLDTEYINNWSLGLDFRILLKTVVSVVKRDGAM